MDFNRSLLTGSVGRLPLPPRMIHAIEASSSPVLAYPLKETLPPGAQVRRSIETGGWEWIPTGDAVDPPRSPLKSPVGLGGGEWQESPVEGLCYRRWTAQQLSHLVLYKEGLLSGKDRFFALTAEGYSWSVESSTRTIYRKPGKILYIVDTKADKTPGKQLEIEARAVTLRVITPSDTGLIMPQKMKPGDFAWVTELEPLTASSKRCLQRVRNYLNKQEKNG